MIEQLQRPSDIVAAAAGMLRRARAGVATSLAEAG